MRVLYLAAGLYVLVAGIFAGSEVRARMFRPEPIQTSPSVDPSTPRGWFAEIKPRCNALEVVTAVRRSPPPAGTQGAGFAAACFSLAGRVDLARTEIYGLAKSERAAAAGIVFGVGHPVADAGDDASAGPIMELVIEFQPDSFMALYHAGMSEFILGQRARSRVNLKRFLELYPRNDRWRSTAISTLQKLADEG